MTPTLSIIIPTCGRASLTRMLASLAPQLKDGDELLVIRRDNVPWGNATRNQTIWRAIGSHLWFMDDDDIATDAALSVIRPAVASDPESVHIFKMDGDIHHTGRRETIWTEPVVRLGNVSSQMIVVPNRPEIFGTWVCNEHGGRAGDFCFLTSTLEKLAREPIFHPDLVASIRP